MRVAGRVFESSGLSWERLAAEAAQFATMIGKKNLINISVAAAGGSELFGAGANGVIVVWYWEK